MGKVQDKKFKNLVVNLSQLIGMIYGYRLAWLLYRLNFLTKNIQLILYAYYTLIAKDVLNLRMFIFGGGESPLAYTSM